MPLGRSPQSDEGMALLEKAAGQGHVHAMFVLGGIHHERKEHEQAVAWTTKAAEAGLPVAMAFLGLCLETGEGVAAPDPAAGMDWIRRAADAGHGGAAQHVSAVYTAGTDGVARSKRRAMQWCRKAADKGVVESCLNLARDMYVDDPHARVEGLVEVGGTGVAMSAAEMEGHDHVPPDVLTSVVHWLRKVVVAEGQPPSLLDYLEDVRSATLEGARHCCNDGCEFVGLLKEFKVCPQCKITRYCSAACQKQDGKAGGHKRTCGTSASIH